MTRIAELITSGANVAIMVNVADLREFFRECSDERQAERAKHETERVKDSEMLSLYDVMAKFNVSKPTLWRWQKTGYLVPIKIGRKLFYRVSDVSKLMEGKVV